MNKITLILSPYHTGLRDHRVGNGPHRILGHGLVYFLEQLGLHIETYEIPPVDDFEGEIGRSFEIMRRTSVAVTETVLNGNFPITLSGNCMATPAVACGLQAARTQQGDAGAEDDEKLGFIYFDSHDDLDSPDVNENGYFDAMGLSMLRGESWKALMGSVPGYKSTKPFNYNPQNNRFLYCGLRDQSSLQRQRVVDAGMEVIWGDTNIDPSDPEARPDFTTEMQVRLDEKPFACSTVVHLDLDVLDAGVYGKVNDYPSPGGLLGAQLVECMEMVPWRSRPEALTVCQFDPDAGDGDRIAKIAIQSVVGFMRAMMGVLECLD